MSRDAFLRRALNANAAFSAVCAAITLGVGSALARVIEVPDRALLRALALGLSAFAAAVALLAPRAARYRYAVLLVTALDATWVAASVALLIRRPDLLSLTGRVVVAAVAAAVGVLATLQILGLRRLIANDGARGAYQSLIEVRRVVDADPAHAWTVISDVGRYAECARGLRFARVTSGAQVGLRRECGDHAGRVWSERCTAWEEGHRYAMEVDTAAPGYPFPLRAMRGEWSVSAAPSGTEVSMRFDFTPKGGLLGDLLAAVVGAPKGQRDAQMVLDCWAEVLKRSAPGAAA